MALSDHTHSVSDLFGIAYQAICEDEPGTGLIEVHPQPHNACPTFLVVRWASAVGRVPVCLQVHLRGGRPLVSLEYVHAAARMDEIIDLLPFHLQFGCMLPKEWILSVKVRRPALSYEPTLRRSSLGVPQPWRQSPACLGSLSEF